MEAYRVLVDISAWQCGEFRTIMISHNTTVYMGGAFCFNTMLNHLVKKLKLLNMSTCILFKILSSTVFFYAHN